LGHPNWSFISTIHRRDTRPEREPLFAVQVQVRFAGLPILDDLKDGTMLLQKQQVLFCRASVRIGSVAAPRNAEAGPNIMLPRPHVEDDSCLMVEEVGILVHEVFGARLTLMAFVTALVEEVGTILPLPYDSVPSLLVHLVSVQGL
jgi:hypothetical protein